MMLPVSSYLFRLSQITCLIWSADRVSIYIYCIFQSYGEKITKSHYEILCLGGVDLVIAKKELPVATADAKPAKLNIQVKI